MPLFTMQTDGVLIDPEFCELTEDILEILINLPQVKALHAKHPKFTEEAFVQLLLLNASIVGQP